jgi:hypothetical protein
VTAPGHRHASRRAGAAADRVDRQPEARRVAERPPSRELGHFRVRADCDCRTCNRKVTWPRKRRFRGFPGGRQGFRCDTCGNVYCGTHVVRVSSFFESLLHGRFRCQLCTVGYKRRRR